MKNLFMCVALLAMLGFTASAQAATPIKVLHSDNPKEALLLSILKLAISKSDRASKYTYDPFTETVTEGRLVEMIKSDELDVMWAGIQGVYEQEMRPIRIPALKGLLGHRIFIIRKGDQSMFDSVRTLSDLQSIPLGQGRFWGDTAILKANNMNVVDPVKYSSLMPMLEGGRFDFFPRGVHEPFAEVVREKHLNLTVEESILIIYPYGMYFYVSVDNKRLAMDIEQGFRNAIADGSYDELFFNHPLIKDALDQADLKSRKVFRLRNPDLPATVPVDDASLWLDLDAL